jgi:hypothetical protein
MRCSLWEDDVGSDADHGACSRAEGRANGKELMGSHRAFRQSSLYPSISSSNLPFLEGSVRTLDRRDRGMSKDELGFLKIHSSFPNFYPIQ